MWLRQKGSTTSANYTNHDAVLAFINDGDIEDLIEADGDYDAEAEYFFGVTISGVGTVLYEIIDGDVNTVQMALSLYGRAGFDGGDSRLYITISTGLRH